MTESEVDTIEFLRVPEKPSEDQLVYVIDMDGQYAAQILRKLHQQGVNAVIVEPTISYSEVKLAGHVIISGSSKSVNDLDSKRIDPQIFTDPEIKVLAICYGMQLMAQELGGLVLDSASREDQMTELHVIDSSTPFLQGYIGKMVLSTHGSKVAELPPGFKEIGKTDAGIAAIVNELGTKVGVQFHPEERTEDGDQLFKNLLFDMWGMKCDEKVIEYNTPLVRVKCAFRDFLLKYEGDDLLGFLSGRIDSTIVGFLAKLAGIDSSKLHLFLVDNGLMRTGEAEQAQSMLVKAGLPVMVYDAAWKFLHEPIEIERKTVVNDEVAYVKETHVLDGAVDPEVKRLICGEWFIKCAFELIPTEYMLDLEKLILIQGTNETDAKESKNIKSHHNVIKAILMLRELGRVFEPLLDALMVKDEIREIARALGLSEDLSGRQPFPGPGLAIRILCNDAHELFEQLEREFEYTSYNHTRITLPVRSVGLQGDERTYKHPKAVFGPSPKDAAEWESFVIDSGERIPSEDESVNRGVFVFGDEPAKIEHTELFVNEISLGKLRQADDIVNAWQKKYGYNKTIAQMPVILAPLKFDGKGEESIILRPFITKNFKSGRPAAPGVDIDMTHFDELLKELQELPWLSRIIYDMTSKPPGTTEWE